MQLILRKFVMVWKITVQNIHEDGFSISEKMPAISPVLKKTMEAIFFDREWSWNVGCNHRSWNHVRNKRCAPLHEISLVSYLTHEFHSAIGMNRVGLKPRKWILYSGGNDIRWYLPLFHETLCTRCGWESMRAQLILFAHRHITYINEMSIHVSCTRVLRLILSWPHFPSLLSPNWTRSKSSLNLRKFPVSINTQNVEDALYESRNIFRTFNS